MRVCGTALEGAGCRAAVDFRAAARDLAAVRNRSADLTAALAAVVADAADKVEAPMPADAAARVEELTVAAAVGAADLARL